MNPLKKIPRISPLTPLLPPWNPIPSLAPNPAKTHHQRSKTQALQVVPSQDRHEPHPFVDTKAKPKNSGPSLVRFPMDKRDKRKKKKNYILVLVFIILCIV